MFLCVAGRAIEGGDVGSGGGGGAGGAGLGVGGARPTLHRHASNSSIGSIGSLSRGMSEVRATGVVFARCGRARGRMVYRATCIPCRTRYCFFYVLLNDIF